MNEKLKSLPEVKLTLLNRGFMALGETDLREMKWRCP